VAPFRTSGRSVAVHDEGIRDDERAIAINRPPLPGPLMTGGARNFVTNLSLPLISVSLACAITRAWSRPVYGRTKNPLLP
jgi:hypothetical protein